MSLPRRFEQVGIVVGSVLMVSLAMSIPWTILSPSSTLSPYFGPFWSHFLLMYGPGFVVGVLVALRMLPVSYGQVWLFGIASWLATLALWWVLGTANVTENQSALLVAWVVALILAGLVAWVVALILAGLVAWAKPHVQFRRNGA